MKFQWYIINLDEGEVVGTNDVELCKQYVNDDGYVVLSAQHRMYYLGSKKENHVEELEEGEPVSGLDPDEED